MWALNLLIIAGAMAMAFHIGRKYEQLQELKRGLERQKAEYKRETGKEWRG